MSKHNPEIPAFPMRVIPGGLTHSTPWVEEQMTAFAIGSEVEVKIMQRRSLPQLQLYWVILHLCVSNSDDKYGRAEDLHDALKISLGYSRKVRTIGGTSDSKKIIDAALNLLRGIRKAIALTFLDGSTLVKTIDAVGILIKELDGYIGETIVLPGSIAFGRMTQGDFKIYFDKAMAQLSAAGYPVEEYLKESEKMLAAYKPAKSYRKGSSDERVEAAEGGDRGPEDEGAESKEAA